MVVTTNETYIEEDILQLATNYGCNSPCTLP
ncbi:Uncharacterised protein [Streptococcus acidominimus]|uniref:Uncharacterized protein n=1 Tax=Streptococcus acidominimus TaxID=1326 RepID=A0A380IEA5_STRAI|nr:Uncharacterised protein [Streptococcus acidominimus]